MSLPPSPTINSSDNELATARWTRSPLRHPLISVLTFSSAAANAQLHLPNNVVLLLWTEPMPSLAVTPAHFHRVGVEFVVIELDLAITFCEVGLATCDFGRAERNADNARAAMKAILHAKDRLSLNCRERELVWEKTSRLVARLVQLEHRLALAAL